MLGKAVKDLGYESYSKFRNDLKYNMTNHKVLKTEILDERDDTGCITVGGNHNFAVSYNGNSKIFIHNSMLDNY